MTIPASGAAVNESLLHEIIAEYLEADHGGTPPSRQELLARHPELTSELQSFFADHDRVKRWAGSPQIASRPAAAPRTPAAGEQVRYFGDYDLLGEIAFGGMGVVYQARQRSLNRVVALKMIRAGVLASNEDIRRFHVEAETAANLDHPNIVPIFEVGEYQGQPYFTMKYIEGGNLTQHLPRLIDDPRAAAQLLTTVAGAVHHAHERGLLHRDLKPANILLDGKGQPHVTDFGLAKSLACPNDPGLTQTGAIIGTPCYMAPEQASGNSKALTKAADIYSLGAILYELLTARPPFRAATPLDTLRQVTDQEPKRPRTLNPRVPPDLETICLKCLHKDPQGRYASAEALAEDLKRFLGDSPIQARRSSLWNGMRRRSRRHSAAALCVVALLVIGVLVFAFWFARVARSREQAVRAEMFYHQQVQAAQAARVDADEQRRRADANFRQARQAVDELLARTAEQEGTRKTAMNPAQRQLLEVALEYYQQAREEKDTNPGQRAEKANACLRVGEIQQRLGNFPEAEKATRVGIALLIELSKKRPADGGDQTKLASAYVTLANTLVEQGKHRAAAKAIEELRLLKMSRWQEYRLAAGIMARCVPLAEQDASLPPDQQHSLALDYGRKAVELLREAVRRGFSDVQQARTAADLEALRSREDFAKLLSQMEAKKKEGE